MEVNVKRRDWIASSLATSALAALPAIGSAAEGQGSRAAGSRQFYLLQRYQLRNGPQTTLMGRYVEALAPALNRAGVKPVGVFYGMAGPENPAVYVLTSYASPGDILSVAAGLANDEEFNREASEYYSAPASEPAYERFETWLLEAFSTVPRIEVPPAALEHKPRIFELRTYENPSEKANTTKIKMFNTAEITIFRRNGLRPVFFGKTMIGARMPSITYMLTFENLAAREKNWSAFGGDPEWKELIATPGYADAEIVSNITNVFLSPARCSQV